MYNKILGDKNMNYIIKKINNFFQIKKYYEVIRNNNISMCSLKNSKINVKGFNNILLIENGDIKRLKIGIYGDNNILKIYQKNIIRDLNIIMEGNNLEVIIEDNCEIGRGVIVCCGNSSSVSIGKNCLLASDIEIRNNDGHSILEDGKVINHSKDIYISDNVWICQNVKILKGVTVGPNSVVALNSLVTKGNYEANVILAGSPAKIIKRNISWDKSRTN